jgi:hypothetical protein
MQTTEVTIFGSNRDSVLDAVSEIRDLCEQRGIEYKGPHPQSVVDFDDKEVHIEDPGVELFGEPPSDLEIEELKGNVMYSRKFVIHRYSSDEVTKEIVIRDYPPNVFLRVEVRETEFIGADRGHVPFSYDPNREYNTELD